MNRRSRIEPNDLQVSASPAEIRRRVLGRLLAVRSLWFASPADQRAWNQAGVPLYVLRDRSDPSPAMIDAKAPDALADLEIGPRLASLWASCFAPALVGRLTAEGETTRVRWTLRWPQPTRVLVVAWWVVLGGWAAAIVTGRTEEGQPTVFWVFLALMSSIGPWLGWQLGHRALMAAWPTLEQAIEQPEVGEDW